MAVNLHGSHFRFGIDELAESTHGWYANLDTSPSHAWAWSVFLLRFTEQETGGTAAANTDATFQYRKNGGAWTAITTTSSNVKAVAAAALTNGGNCTKRLTGTGTFETTGAGQTEDGTSGGNANDIAASGNSETECGLQFVEADLASGDVIEFRFISPDWTVTMDVVPSITVVKAAALTNAGGIASGESIGQPSLAANLTNIGAIVGAEAFGTPVVSAGVFLADVGGLAGGEAFGQPSLSVALSAVAIAGAEAFGTANLAVGIAAVAIDGAEAFGVPTITVGILLTNAGDIASAEAFDSPAIAVILAPAGIASEELFGTPNVSVPYIISPDGIVSEESFGTAAVSIVYTISGVVRDKNKSPVAGATTYLFRTSDGALINMGYSLSDGEYRFVTEDNYTPHFIASFFGSNPRRGGLSVDTLVGK